MDSEKVKDIKKGLECCSVSSGRCDKCSFRKKGVDCDTYLAMDALKLINELESENERLKTSEFNSCQELDNACTQIHSLEDRIAELEEDKEKWQMKAVNYCQRVKSYGIECIIDNDIDETLKEFINGKV